MLMLQTFTGHATEVRRLLHIPVGDSIEHSYFLSAAVNDRVVNAWYVLNYIVCTKFCWACAI